jgi:hypothetical protein
MSYREIAKALDKFKELRMPDGNFISNTPELAADIQVFILQVVVQCYEVLTKEFLKTDLPVYIEDP